MGIILALACLVCLLAVSAFFSSSETALFSLDPHEVERVGTRNPRAGQLVRRLLSRPTQLLSTILIGNTIVNVVASVVAFAALEQLFPRFGEVIAIPLMTVLLLILGEITPKRIAMRYPVQMSAAYAATLAALNTILAPARALLDAVTNWIDEYVEHAPLPLTDDEFRTAVSISEEEGVLDEEERTMVDGIIRLEDIQASDVMTPRVDIVGLDLDESAAKYLDIARHAKVHFLPIYRRTRDDVEGFLDVLKYLLSPSHNLDECRVPVSYIPETASLDTLLTKFQREGLRVAIVADEYGGTAGLITLGDIIEEIVEDVENEYRVDHSTIAPLGADRWLIEASTSLEEINYELDLELEAEGADRISGWVIAQAEEIPKPGQIVEAQKCRVRVQRVRKNRITWVQLTKLPPSPDEDREEDEKDRD